MVEEARVVDNTLSHQHRGVLTGNSRAGVVVAVGGERRWLPLLQFLVTHLDFVGHKDSTWEAVIKKFVKRSISGINLFRDQLTPVSSFGDGELLQR